MAGETILIIEDRRENIVHLANNVLKPNGYQVLTAMDGQRGLRRALTEDPDLIIMDLKMPKMDGLEVLSALRERQIDTPVILTTFYGSEQVAEQAMRLGAAAYVIKPFTVEEMLEAVGTALAQRRPAPRPAKPRAELDEAMPLTRQVERWMRDMNILTRIGKALVAQLDIDKVCARAVEATVYITRAEHAFLFLKATGEGGELRLRASRGPKDRHVRQVDQVVEGGLAAQVAGTGKMALQSGSATDPFLTEVAGEALGPVAAAPLRWQQEILGTLVAARSPSEPAFSEADQEWLGGLADYVAIAIRNADAFQRLVEQPEAPRVVESWQEELAELGSMLKTAGEMAERLADKLSTWGEVEEGTGQAT
jgi:two-component system NtrC family sensor kinase